MRLIPYSSLSLTNALKGALLIATAITAVACNSSNKNSDEPLSDSNNPFNNPDPNGTSTIARLAYPAARDLTDDLVSMSYLRQYYELDRAISNLLQGGDLISDVTIDCPAGGTASGALSIFSFDVVFDNCVIDNRTLSGGLTRDASFSVFGLGDSQEVSIKFDKLIIDAGALGLVELTGVSTRNDRSFAIIECSGGPAITHSVSNQIDSARIEQNNVETTISSASWQQNVVTGPQQQSGNPSAECLIAEHLTFEGATMAMSPTFNGNKASIEKRGDIMRGVDVGTDSTASLSGDFADGSSLSLTMTTDTEREVQVDIVSDGAAVSFVDSYRFEARQDIPPIIGESTSLR